MAQQPFRAEDMETDTLVDRQGQRVGRVIASHYANEPEKISDLEIELDDAVREKRLVNEEKIRVDVGVVHLENGRPKLRLTLDELFEAEDVSHAHENHRRGVPDQPPHMSSERAADKASGHERPGTSR